MKAAALGIVGAALLVAACLAFAPATLVDRRVSAATGGSVRVVDAAGTVWNGRGALADAAGRWRLPVAWTVDMAGLWRGVLDLRLAPLAGAEAPAGTAEFARTGVVLRGFRVDVPARAFASVVPSRLPLTFGGTVVVTAADLAMGSGEPRGAVAARWHDARVVTGSTVVDLGTVDVALAPQEDRLAGRIANSGGDLRIDGTVSLAASAVGADVTVTPQASAPELVKRALPALGPPDGNGGVRVTWRGAPR